MRHDYLADRAANYRLMQLIQAWWAKRGYRVRVWLERATDPTNGTHIWVIRSSVTQPVHNLNPKYMVQ